MTTITDNLQRIDAIATLPDDWNSYGAPRLDSALLDTARAFIMSLPSALQPVYVVPGPGAVQFEWGREHEPYLEVEVSGDGFGYLVQEPGSEAQENEGVTQDVAMRVVERYCQVIRWS
jgi:hypothetical protein